ncbi:MAG TPA: hypothetical protein VFW50_00790 [Streptosporangiaceae bacterium]|nr:hypothetical protein [Streptosporangiaceae bacterium]
MVIRRPTAAEIQPYASSKLRAVAIRSSTVSSTDVRGSCHGGIHSATSPRPR